MKKRYMIAHQPIPMIPEGNGISYGYEFSACGDTFEECMEDATVTAFDVNGSELNSKPLRHALPVIRDAVARQVDRYIMQRNRKVGVGVAS